MYEGTVRRGGIHLCDDGPLQPGLIGDRDREGITQIFSWPLRGYYRLRRHVEPTDELSDVTRVRVKLAPAVLSEHSNPVPGEASASCLGVSRGGCRDRCCEEDDRPDAIQPTHLAFEASPASSSPSRDGTGPAAVPRRVRFSSPTERAGDNEVVLVSTESARVAGSRLAMGIIFDQGDLQAGRVVVVSVFILVVSALAFVGAFASTPSTRTRLTVLGAATGGLLTVGVLGIFSIGLPLLVAGVMCGVAWARFSWAARPVPAGATLLSTLAAVATGALLILGIALS